MSSPTTFPDARIPTEGELRARKNLLIQAWRFAVLNLKMVAMVTKGHH
jgi:hypothetical protein